MTDCPPAVAADVDGTTERKLADRTLGEECDGHARSMRRSSCEARPFRRRQPDFFPHTVNRQYFAIPVMAQNPGVYSGCEFYGEGEVNFCHVQIVRLGFDPLSATGPLGENLILDNGIVTTRVDEPGGGQSDRLLLHAFTNIAYLILYSDSPGGGDNGCTYYNNCPITNLLELMPIVETGARQLALTVTWSDHRVDRFYFISEVSEAPPVPEPASLVLLGTGLLVGGRRWRTRQAKLSS